MLSIIIGVLLIAFTVVACMPSLLNWGSEILLVLKGAAPVLSALIGITAIFVGISDLRERKEAKKEELESKSSEENK